MDRLINLNLGKLLGAAEAAAALEAGPNVDPRYDWSSLRNDPSDKEETTIVRPESLLVDPRDRPRSQLSEHTLRIKTAAAAAAAAAAGSPRPDATDVIQDPVLCQIRHWDVRLCRLLGHGDDADRENVTLLDWGKVQSGVPLLDCLVGATFAVEWVVFWLQNKCGMRNLTLLDIVCHEEPMRWFMATVDLVRREWSNTVTDDEWKPVLSYWLNATHLGPETPANAFVLPHPAVLDSKHGVHSMVREAMAAGGCKKPEEESVDVLEAVLLSMLGLESSDLFVKIRHARVRYAECLGLLWHLRRHKKKKPRMQGRFARALAWLQQFKAKGCTCSA